jgi:excisionase family DNA binding protein
VPRPLESARTVGDDLGVCEETIRRLARDGRIPAYRVGRYLRFDREAVLAALRTGDAATASARVEPDFDALDREAS